MQQPGSNVSEPSSSAGNLRAGLLWTSVALVAGLCLAALAVTVRRMGWDAPPLNLLWLTITALTATAAAWLSTLLWLTLAAQRWGYASRCAGCRGCMRFAPTAALLLLGTAATVPSAPAASVAALWVFWATSELARHRLWLHMPREQSSPAGCELFSISLPQRAQSQEEISLAPTPDVEETTIPPAAESPSALLEKSGEDLESPADEENWLEPLLVDPDLTQYQARRRMPDGGETVHAVMRVSFAATQRTATGHLAFCPPLASTPEVEFEQTDGPECRIALAACLAHGLRLELKRSDAGTPAEVSIELLATSGVTAKSEG